MIVYPSTTYCMISNSMEMWPIFVDCHPSCNLGADSEADTDAGEERGSKASAASVVKVCCHQLLPSIITPGLQSPEPEEKDPAILLH